MAKILCVALSPTSTKAFHEFVQGKSTTGVEVAQFIFSGSRTISAETDRLTELETRIKEEVDKGNNVEVILDSTTLLLVAPHLQATLQARGLIKSDNQITVF